MGCGESNTHAETEGAKGVDKYERKEMIGVGHHGRVYRCLYGLNGKDYAWKIIDRVPNGISNEAVLASRGEVERMSKLSHAKIANYRQIDFSKGEISLMMELGKDVLKKQIQKTGKMDESQIATIIEQVL